MRYRVSKKESWNGGKWLNVFLTCVTATVPALLAAIARIKYFEFKGRRAHGMEGVELNFHVNMPPLLPDVNHTYDDADTFAQIMHQTSLDVGYPVVSLIAFTGFMMGRGPSGVLPDFGVGFGGLGGEEHHQDHHLHKPHHKPKKCNEGHSYSETAPLKCQSHLVKVRTC
ncbi:hypothetical protein Tco_0575924 [Tanacetum coccineum]